MKMSDTSSYKEKDEKTLANLEVTTHIYDDEDDIRPENTSQLRRVAQVVPLAAGFILINEFWYANYYIHLFQSFLILTIFFSH